MNPLTSSHPNSFIDLSENGNSPRAVSLDRTVGRVSSLRGVLVVCCLLSPIAGCKPQTPSTKKEAPPENVVTGPLMLVEKSSWPLIVRCQGSLVSDETTVVSAKVAGRVQSVLAEVGDVVQAGTPLVQLDDSEYKLLASQADAQLTQARAAVGLKPDDPVESLNPDNSPPVREAKAVLDEAVKSLERLRTLVSGAAISETDIDLAEAAERVAAARLASAQNSVREKIANISVQTALRDLAIQRLQDTKVVAPFAGRIQARSIAAGTYVQTGQSLMALVKTNKLRFHSSIPEKYAHLLKIDLKVDIRFDLSNQVREGTITRINPTLDQQNRSLAFEVDIMNDDGTMRSGMFGEANIELDPDAIGISLPTSSVQRFAGVDKVWKIVDGKVKEQIVSLGTIRGDRIEIKSGIQPGDQLLSDASLGKPGRYEAAPQTASAPSPPTS